MDMALPPEDDEGCVEYKCLVRGDRAHIENLKTQMNCRLRAGKGRAVYWVGVMDNGCKLGLAEPHYDASIKHLRTVITEIGAVIERIDRQIINTPPPDMHSRLELVAPADAERWVARVTVTKEVQELPMGFDVPTTPPGRANIVDLCVIKTVA